MVDSIKITALQDIGANIAYTTLTPVVDMTGTPTTKKSTLQNIGNLILGGAGGSYFPRAAQANLALSVANAAQPNITSVGTLTSLTVSGNITAGNINGGNLVVANFFSGDGGFLTNVAGGGSNYSNSNVANYLPTYNGTIGANLVTSNSNLRITTDYGNANISFTFGSGGALYWPAPGLDTWAIEPNGDLEFEIKSTTNVVISTDITNVNSHFTFDSMGIFTAPSNVNLLGSRLNVGPDAANAANLLNPTLVIANTGAQYIQAAIINNDETGSSDWAADGAGGGDNEAWTDMGFAGYGFNDANYSITAPGDGYLFVQAYANGLGGNMVLATGDHSNTADIIFATGGFLTSNEFARIDHANSAFALTRANSFIQFAATGSISNPANTSLDPLNPNVSTMVLTPDSSYTSQVLVLDPTAPGHIHLRAPGSNIDEPYSNIFLGGEDTSFEVTQGSNNVAKIHSGSNTWTFNNTGNLETPGLVGTYIKSAPGGYMGVAAINDGGDLPAQLVSIDSNTNLGTTAISAYANNAQIQSNINGTIHSWVFDNTGNLTLPGNTLAINFANNSSIFGDVAQWTTAPVANTSAGTAGQAAYDSGGNLYVCVATNTWAKFAGTTSW